MSKCIFSECPRKTGKSGKSASSRSDSLRITITASWRVVLRPPLTPPKDRKKSKKKRLDRYASRIGRNGPTAIYPDELADACILQVYTSTGQLSPLSAPAGAVPALPAPRRTLARFRIDDLGQGWVPIPGKPSPRILEALAVIFASTDYSRSATTFGCLPTITLNHGM
jgi:hypothetical protein